MNYNLTANSVAFSVLVFAFATGTAAASGFYIEGQLGTVAVKDVSTPTFSGSESGYTLSNFKADLSYDSDTFVGLELGYNVTPDVRLSLNYSSFSLNWNAVTGSGTISDGTSTVALSGTLKRGTLDDDSLLDNKVKLFMANVYYDLPLRGAITPFVGLGLGQANISNAGNETALSFSIGANYDIGEKSYLGIKYTKYTVNGPTDELGFQYNDIKANAVNISYGFRF